jgi:hypothetical protein
LDARAGARYPARSTAAINRSGYGRAKKKALPGIGEGFVFSEELAAYLAVITK